MGITNTILCGQAVPEVVFVSRAYSLGFGGGGVCRLGRAVTVY